MNEHELLLPCVLSTCSGICTLAYDLKLFSLCLTAPARPVLFVVVGVGAIAYMMKTDVRQGSSMLRRNLKQIRAWMETQGDAAE